MSFENLTWKSSAIGASFRFHARSIPYASAGTREMRQSWRLEFDFASPCVLSTPEQPSDQRLLCATQEALTGLGLPPKQQLEAREHCEPLLGPLHPSRARTVYSQLCSTIQETCCQPTRLVLAQRRVTEDTTPSTIRMR